MKTIVLAVLVCASSTLAHHHDSSKEFLNTCMTELNVTKCEKGYPNKNDTNFKCIPRCIMLKKGLISKSGEPIAEKFAPEIGANLTSCYNKVKGKPECDREMELGRCIRNATMTLHKKMSLACQTETNTTLPKHTNHWRRWNKTEGTNTNGTSGKHHIGGHGCLWKNKTFACYNRCMLLKQGMINEKNEIVSKKLESIMDKLNKSNKNVIKIDEILKNCTNSTNQEDKCLEVMDRAKCIWEHISCKGVQFKEGAIADATDDDDINNNPNTSDNDTNDSTDEGSDYESENTNDGDSEDSTDYESENTNYGDSDDSTDYESENTNYGDSEYSTDNEFEDITYKSDDSTDYPSEVSADYYSGGSDDVTEYNDYVNNATPD